MVRQYYTPSYGVSRPDTLENTYAATKVFPLSCGIGAGSGAPSATREDADDALPMVVWGMGAGNGAPSAMSNELDIAVWGIGAGRGAPSACKVCGLSAGLYAAWLTEQVTGSTISKAKNEIPAGSAYFFMGESSGAHHEERVIGRPFEVKNVPSAEQDQS
jgi:hypothetical protein